MTHCQYLDDRNDPCESTTPITIRCRECSKDVCEEHAGIGSKESVGKPLFMETVLCIRCAYEEESFERRAWIRQERRKAERVNTGEIIARGHLRAVHDLQMQHLRDMMSKDRKVAAEIEALGRRNIRAWVVAFVSFCLAAVLTMLIVRARWGQ